ncbi:hypothetical protein BDI4_120196 [Burkholderia diffusa]|nr:hypothetical protein BDI4_120196 [Burkholderia diffusa]
MAASTVTAKSRWSRDIRGGPLGVVGNALNFRRCERQIAVYPVAAGGRTEYRKKTHLPCKPTDLPSLHPPPYLPLDAISFDIYL